VHKRQKYETDADAYTQSSVNVECYPANEQLGGRPDGRYDMRHSRITDHILTQLHVYVTH